MKIGDILTKSWQIIWKYKILWIFGILASCVEGGGGGGGSGNSGYRFDGDEFDFPAQGFSPEVVRFFEKLSNQPEQYIGIIAAVILLLCVLWIVGLALGTIGRIGLIKGALKADNEPESLSFGELWSESLPYFWKVIGLWLILWLVSFLMAIVLALLALGSIVTMGIGLICLLPLLCLMIPLIWLLSLVFEQATIAMIAEERGVVEAVQRAWEVFRANIGNYLLMALVLFILQLAVGLIIALPIILIVVPAAFGLALGADTGITTTLLISGLCFMVYLPVLILLSGILRSYIWTAWTLTFTRLTNPAYLPAQPEILDAS